MKASVQFYSIAFLLLGSVKFKLFHSFPGKRQLEQKKKKKQADLQQEQRNRKTWSCSADKKEQTEDLAFIGTRSGGQRKQTPASILDSFTPDDLLHDSLTFSGNRLLQADKRFL